MLKSTLIFSLILCVASNSIRAQTGLANIDTLLVGTWKGSSICQVKNSPCHDEVAVYHISKKNGIDTFYVDGRKVVNGEEVAMGILPFIYNKKTNQFTSTAYGTWTFSVEGNKLEGTLADHGDLIRKIKLYKHY